jgi:hypothetical protein
MVHYLSAEPGPPTTEEARIELAVDETRAKYEVQLREAIIRNRVVGFVVGAFVVGGVWLFVSPSKKRK